jgi:malonyl-ACP O-methyltransferase BioC
MEIIVPAKKLIAQSFSRRSKRYCSSAAIQRDILAWCVSLMKKSAVTSGKWLDAGCGAGMLGPMLEPDFSGLELFGMDIAFGSLRMINARNAASTRSVLADIENQPYDNASFDGILVSSVLHWMEDPGIALREMARILKPRGTVVFASFLRGSFFELCTVREHLELSIPVRFIDGDSVCATITKSGFDLLEYTDRNQEYYFNSAWEILKYLSDIGSTVVSGKRLSRSGLLALCDEYEKRFRNGRGVPLTCSVGWGMAVKRERV